MEAFGQSINANGSSGINVTVTQDPYTNLILILIPVIATAIIGYYTIQYTKREHIRAAMSEVFQLLEAPHKSAEANLRDAFRNGVLMKDGHLNPDHEGPASVVKTNYDKIGAMMSSKLIPRPQYYTMFGIVTVVSYYILKESIEDVRKDGKLHRSYFTNLAIDCFEYWMKRPDKQRPLITDPKGTPITKEMLGKRIKLPK